MSGGKQKWKILQKKKEIWTEIEKLFDYFIHSNDYGCGRRIFFVVVVGWENNIHKTRRQRTKFEMKQRVMCVCASLTDFYTHSGWTGSAHNE